MDTTRSTGIADIIANSQKGTAEKSTVSARYITGPQTVNVTDASGSTGILATGAPPYFCGNGALGTNTIWCSFWICG